MHWYSRTLCVSECRSWQRGGKTSVPPSPFKADLQKCHSAVAVIWIVLPSRTLKGGQNCAESMQPAQNPLLSLWPGSCSLPAPHLFCHSSFDFYSTPFLPSLPFNDNLSAALLLSNLISSSFPLLKPCRRGASYAISKAVGNTSLGAFFFLWEKYSISGF